MSKHYQEFPEYDGKSRVNYLTETVESAGEPQGANIDYSDILNIGEVYREARKNLTSALPGDDVNFVFEVKKGKYNTKDFLSDKEIDARSEKSKGVLKALKDSIAKDVMCDRMSTAVAKKSGALGKNAELFKGVFDRGVFNSVSVAETNANAKEFISKITDEKVSQDEKANLIKDRIEKMSKIASEMRVGDEKNFTENFEKYMDYSYALKGLGDLNKIAVNYGIVLDKITLAKAQALSNFGNRFRKLCVAKAEQMIDPAYVTLKPDKAESYYDGVEASDLRKTSFYKDGEASFEEVSDNLCGTLVKLNLLEKGFDPDKSVISLSKDTEKIITFDELGTAVHGKEPVIVFGDDGEFKSYMEFRNDGSAYEVQNVKKIDLDMSKEENVKEM
ncbi:MAG: hypothetical protein MJ072_04130, partial [Clostridia bacterium]|nr:hypothetical protein [Clostridia bacterium]